jgi:hypothetical protein
MNIYSNLNKSLCEIFEIFGINQFCKKNGLAHSAMVLVAQGKRNHHKGWKCNYKSVVPKQHSKK